MSRVALQFQPVPWLVFKLVLVRQCKLLGLKRRELAQVVTFFLAVISLFHIAIGPTQLTLEIAAGVLYSSWLFALMLPLGMLLENDFRRGYLQQFYLTGVWLEWSLFAHYLGTLLCYSMLYVMVLPIALLLLHVPYHLWPAFLAAGLLMTAGTIITLILCNALVVGIGSAPTLLCIMALPMLVPSVILSTLGIQQPILLLILFLVCVGMLPICLVGTSYALMAAFEDS